MTDKKPPKKPRASQKPSPIDELRQMVEEDIEEQRKFVQELKRKLN
ncbi:hypothetical protein ACVIW2_005960 [Bradyrhizobium huanghuaihaiense]|nr:MULTISPECIES: hypothetical protein [unclassified Bradyrhizobium]MBW7974174.1 hypothetical protein [Bradyrhizobium sp. BR 10289]